jgi:hypothetical protein
LADLQPIIVNASNIRLEQDAAGRFNLTRVAQVDPVAAALPA